MSCSVFVHIKYSKELEEKIRKMSGITPKRNFSHFEIAQVPEELFSQHKKDVDAHRWVVEKDGTMGHYPTNPGKWEYKGHGFDIWLGFKGEDGETDIVFVVPCHWNSDHGDLTILDLKEWIKDNLGEVEIKEQKVTY
jgi:hypothetical protein